MHRGEILKKQIKDSGIPISKIANQIGISRGKVYDAIKNPEMDLGLIKKIGDVIKVDFSVNFSEMQTQKNEDIKIMDPDSLRKQIELKDKEIGILKDEIIELSRELVKTMKSVIQKDEIIRDIERRLEDINKKA